MKIIVTESQIRTALLEDDIANKLSSIEIPSQMKTIAQIMATPDYDEETSDTETPETGDTPKTPNRPRRIVFRHPLGKKYKVGGGFNDVRGNSIHKSVDITAPSGTPVLAPADGTVVYAGDVRKRCGGYIKIHHGSYKTKFCHLSKWVVRRGQQVKLGQVIGYVGGGPKDPHRGSSTGSHLHYEILSKSDTHINPNQPQFGFA